MFITISYQKDVIIKEDMLKNIKRFKHKKIFMLKDYNFFTYFERLNRACVVLPQAAQCTAKSILSNNEGRTDSY